MYYRGKRTHGAEQQKSIIRKLANLKQPPGIAISEATARKCRGVCSNAHHLIHKTILKAIAIIIDALQKRAAEVKEINQQGFTDWIVKAPDKGAGPAHGWTSQKSKAPPLPEVIVDGKEFLYNPPEKGEYYRKMWDAQWRKESRAPFQMRQAFIRCYLPLR